MVCRFYDHAGIRLQVTCSEVCIIGRLFLSLHLVLLANAYLCTNRWWTAISLKASGPGERGGNVCAFGMRQFPCINCILYCDLWHKNTVLT